MDMIEKAIIFATKAHAGQKRKVTKTNYILHPLEVMLIIDSINHKPELLVAALLHDVVEDAGVLPETIKEEFGDYVYELVLSETEFREANISKKESWYDRKYRSLQVLKNTDNIDIKALWLADKLSNIRSMYISYQAIGDDLWLNFNQKDAKMHEWYYRSVMEYVKPLEDTYAYHEFVRLVNAVFGGKKNEND